MAIVWVKIEGRKFRVDFDDNGEPVRIYERKKFGEGTLFCGVYNAVYWHSKHHAIGGAKFLTARIIAAARAKRAAT